MGISTKTMTIRATNRATSRPNSVGYLPSANARTQTRSEPDCVAYRAIEAMRLPVGSRTSRLEPGRRSRHRRSPQPGEHENRGGDDGDTYRDEAHGHQTLLPRLTVAACRGNWRHRRRAEDRRQQGHGPIRVRPVQRTPVGRTRPSRREPHRRPDGAQRHQERPVHHAFEVCGQSHARIRDILFDKAREETQQEQEHAVPDQPTPGVFDARLLVGADHQTMVDGRGGRVHGISPLNGQWCRVKCIWGWGVCQYWVDSDGWPKAEVPEDATRRGGAAHPRPHYREYRCIARHGWPC